MINPVGFRFRPSDEEIVDHYLRLKNLGTNTSHVDEAISTVNICSFDPWDLPSQSRMESRDRVWYFFGLKENKYNRGERQSRRTSSGFWKKTGVTMDIMRKSGNREKMGEKRVLVFHLSKTLGGSKSDWVMHEYDATSLSPNQMMTYTFCKVKFKGQETDFSSSSGGEIVEHSRSLIPPMNNIGGSEGSSIQRLTSQQLQNPGFLDLDALDSDFGDLWKYDSKILFGDDDDVGNEQSKIVFMDEDRSDYRPKKPLTGVFTGHSSDDSDSDSISSTTSSIQTSSTCDSFGSSNHRIDLREDPNSTVKLISLTQEVSKTLGASIDTSEKKKNPCDDAQGTEIGEYKMGHGMIKNKRAGFFYRIIQRFVKKIHLCSSISRT